MTAQTVRIAPNRNGSPGFRTDWEMCACGVSSENHTELRDIGVSPETPGVGVHTCAVLFNLTCSGSQGTDYYSGLQCPPAPLGVRRTGACGPCPAQIRSVALVVAM